MFICHVCGSSVSHAEVVSEVFNIQGKFYLVENIPATVCDRCGDGVFSRETTDRIRIMLHRQEQPIKSIPLEVFSYGEAV